MKNTVLSALFLLLCPGVLFAQAVAINTDGSSPDPSAILDVKSTNKGVLIPRMTTAQRTAIAAPATGLLVYDTSTGGFWVYTGSVWRALSAILVDADGDTRIQVEASPDEDIIRMDLAGSERLVLKRNTGGNTMLELPNTLNNTFLGTGAGNSTTTGRANVAIGVAALNKSATRSYLVAVGDSALFNNSVGAQELYHGTVNTALGSKALFSNTLGDANTATGYRALYANTSGYSNTASGAGALGSNTSGYNNTAMGFSALESNTTGRINTAVGMYVMKNNTTGNSNTAMGVSALYSNTTGYSNVAIGNNALFRNTTSSSSVAVGDSALYNNGNGVPPIEDPYAVGNTAVGTHSLFANTVGSYNTATGLRSLNENTTGNYNTANGVYTLRANQTGWYNTAMGMEAMRYNVSGEENTATGMQALKNNTSGRLNTANGSYALLFNSTGIQNTAFGAAALSYNTTGSGNTALGFNADVQTDGLTNATAIGANASVNASNCLVLGSINGINGATSSVKVGIGVNIPTHYLTISAPDDETLRLIGPGTNGAGSRFNFGDADFVYIEETTDDILRIQANRIGIGRPPTTNRLEVEGEASKSSAGSWVANSDARLKKNIRPLNSQEMLQKMLTLRGITYEWNDNKTGSKRPEGIQYGFTAQNIQTVFPTLVEEDNLGYLQTAYGTYDAMTVEAIRALHEEIEALKAENEDLKTQLRQIMAALQTAGIGIGQGK